MDVNFNVEVSAGAIDWRGTDRGWARRMAELEATIRRDSGALKAREELILLYEDTGRDQEAQELADRSVELAAQAWRGSGSEEEARRYASIAASTSASSDHSIPAYRALQPFLESGRAREGTVVAAIKNRTAAGDFALADRIAELYLPLYPQSAKLHIEKYQITLGANLIATIRSFVEDTRETIKQQHGRDLSSVSLNQIVTPFLEVLTDKVDYAALDRALELEPDNYEYHITAAVQRIMTLFFSATLLAADSPEFDFEAFIQQFRRDNPEEIAAIEASLLRAETNRPPHDVQVYLAETLLSFCLGRQEAAEMSSWRALAIRPDLSEAYDAVIMAVNMRQLAGQDEGGAEVDRVTEELVRRRLSAVRESASDYYSLACLKLADYGRAEAGRRATILSEMGEALDRALELEPDHRDARAGRAVYLVLSGDSDDAITLLEELMEEEDADRTTLLTYLGVAHAVLGRDRQATEMFNRALKYDPQNGDALYALEALRQ